MIITTFYELYKFGWLNTLYIKYTAVPSYVLTIQFKLNHVMGHGKIIASTPEYRISRRLSISKIGPHWDDPITHIYTYIQ